MFVYISAQQVLGYPTKIYIFRCKAKAYTKPPESRSLPNVDMVKFRALLGEATLHKKGTAQYL
jgi:hypothetical protein